MSVRHFVLIAMFACVVGITVADDSDGSSCSYDGDRNDNPMIKLSEREIVDTLSPFAAMFLEEMPSEDFFLKLFDVSFDQSKVNKIFFLNCVYYGVNMGLKCPINLCKNVASGAESAFKNNITRMDYFFVVSNTLEGSLKEEGKLTPLNVVATREKIKNFIKDVAQFLCKPEVKGPTEALFAMDDGAMKYFKSLGVSSRKDVSFIAKSFGEQFEKVGQKPLLEVDVKNLEIQI